jgi:hypothetical protein
MSRDIKYIGMDVHKEQPRLAEYDPPQNGNPEEKSWSDCGPITLLWGLFNDFLSFPAPSSR